MNNHDNHHKKDERQTNIDKQQQMNEHISSSKALDDEQRVKVMSPGMLVVKRFVRNKLAVIGFIIIVAMFIFSFVGGLVSPYGESQVFGTTEITKKDYAGVKVNTEYQYTEAPDGGLPVVAKTKLILAINKGEDTFEAKDVTYNLLKEGNDFYRVAEKTPAGTFSVKDGKVSGVSDAGVKEALETAIKDGVSSFEVGDTGYYYTLDGNSGTLETTKDIEIVSKLMFSTISQDTKLDYEFKFKAERAMNGSAEQFEAGGQTYRVEKTEDSDGNISATFYLVENGTETEYASASRFSVTPIGEGIFLTKEFKEAVQTAIGENASEFTFTDENGEESVYTVEQDDTQWIVKRETETQVNSLYESPSLAHPLGTDGNGMDMLTRLMYGGRISLMVGFVVVFAEVILGVALGGIAGYFGGWIDNLIMRLVDIFNCIPAMPLFIILGSILDFLKVDPMVRVFLLMLILSLVQWPAFARLVRGQILSLREQEFMIATEATGISIFRRIFVHLIPNVMPQVIVMATMSLGSTIIFEATLSFLGLGVKYPLASWGYIINAVNDVYVLTNYWFVWIPAGLLLVITILGFNFVGDGLRDAFDPKMKR